MKQFLGVDLSEKQNSQLEFYKSLLNQYHKTLDLMSDKGISDINVKFEDAFRYAETLKQSNTKLDTASLSKDHIKPKTILDVGSGAGLPAIVMAILLPHDNLILTERRQRRIAFLNIVKAKLELDNVRMVLGDVQQLTGEIVDVVTAQAVGSFLSLFELTHHLYGGTSQIISRKGSEWTTEIDYLSEKLEKGFTSHKFLLTKAEALSDLSSHGKLVSVKLTKN